MRIEEWIIARETAFIYEKCLLSYWYCHGTIIIFHEKFLFLRFQCVSFYIEMNIKAVAISLIFKKKFVKSDINFENLLFRCWLKLHIIWFSFVFQINPLTLQNRIKLTRFISKLFINLRPQSSSFMNNKWYLNRCYQIVTLSSMLMRKTCQHSIMSR